MAKQTSSPSCHLSRQLLSHRLHALQLLSHRLHALQSLWPASLLRWLRRLGMVAVLAAMAVAAAAMAVSVAAVVVAAVVVAVAAALCGTSL